MTHNIINIQCYLQDAMANWELVFHLGRRQIELYRVGQCAMDNIPADRWSVDSLIYCTGCITCIVDDICLVTHASQPFTVQLLAGPKIFSVSPVSPRYTPASSLSSCTAVLRAFALENVSGGEAKQPTLHLAGKQSHQQLFCVSCCVLVARAPGKTAFGWTSTCSLQE